MASQITHLRARSQQGFRPLAQHQASTASQLHGRHAHSLLLLAHRQSSSTHHRPDQHRRLHPGSSTSTFAAQSRSGRSSRTRLPAVELGQARYAHPHLSTCLRPRTGSRLSNPLARVAQTSQPARLRDPRDSDAASPARERAFLGRLGDPFERPVERIRDGDEEESGVSNTHSPYFGDVGRVSCPTRPRVWRRGRA